MTELIKDNIPKLKELYEKHLKLGLEYDNDWNSGSDYREAHRLEKIINFLELEDELDIEYESGGLIFINNKFIVSLASNKWRVRGKSIWYRHSNNLQSFVDKYILKGKKYETDKA